ncbi:magnesium transporter [Algisphaera agarilytica]|uniref:Magnesium transporter MgtE n=1 Tax=Algisphaera agarilytica TaxID=1385975 RepID=A0A7X0HBS0_9BACT|nr:magnesium transporter [Algisphaera agarilytica]MBB6431514.1 magnesium transporter [Algisphaera agarilytica]
MPTQPFDPVLELSDLVDGGDASAIAAFLHDLPPEETPYTISHITEERRTQMFSLLAESEPEFAADLMEHFDDAHAADIVGDLEPETAAAIVDEMDSDEQADVLGELPSEDAEAILDEMSPEEAIDARRRMRYDEDTAGGLMITEYLAYSVDQTVEAVADDLREHGDEYGEYEVRYIYSVDADHKLIGTVPMRRLVMSPRGTHVSKLILSDPIVVTVDTHVDELEDLFDRIDFSSVPVIDEAHKLVGVVQRHAVQEARGEAAEEDLAKFGGIVRGEELRSMPLASRAGRRLSYLLPISGLLMLSASVIHLFIETVEQVPVLAMFLPVVAGLCGSGGGQAVAVSMREISLGLIKPADLITVMGKEAAVAFIDGVILGVVLFLIVWIWQGSPVMGLVVGGSVPLVLITAKITGGCVPLLLRKIGLDPAMASGPVVTTVVDLVSFLVVLALATMMLASLTTPTT